MKQEKKAGHTLHIVNLLYTCPAARANIGNKNKTQKMIQKKRKKLLQNEKEKKNTTPN